MINYKQTNHPIVKEKAIKALIPKVGFIGFGEVTYHILKGLNQEKVKGIGVYSRPNSEKTEYYRRRAFKTGANLVISLEELIQSADVIISAVRGDTSLEVAKQAAEFLRPGQIYADLNNAAPTIKKATSAIVNAQGAKFVDIALLELPIQVKHKSLMYVSGDGALEFKQKMSPLNMNIQYIGPEPGKAAMIKALVNIFMKGLQGIYLEFAVCAQKAGVSLELLEPLLVSPVLNLPKEKDMAFWIIRGALLAGRKSKEMKEIVEMMHELNVDPIMLQATIERLSWVAQFKLNRFFDATMPVEDYQSILSKLMEVGRDENIAIR